MTAAEIEALGGYYGAAPRPDDFESFWQARMAEADAVPLHYTVTQAQEVPSWDSCEFLDLWFTGMEGARLYAKFLRPRRSEPMPLVLQFHAFGGRYGKLHTGCAGVQYRQHFFLGDQLYTAERPAQRRRRPFYDGSQHSEYVAVPRGLQLCAGAGLSCRIAGRLDWYVHRLGLPQYLFCGALQERPLDRT